MKYIRTKDKIITYDNYARLLASGYKPKIIKEADTVEELCDAFIYIKPDQSHKISNAFKHDIKLINNGGYICGAIWNNKGLIYAAEIKDNGKLEPLYCC